MFKLKTSKRNFGDKVVKNTLFNSLGKFSSVFVTFITTPYIVSVLGKELFGVWAIFGVLTQYFNLLDFGVRPSFIKYISHYYTRREYQKINQVINTGVIFYLFTGALLVVAVFLLSDWLIGFFSISAESCTDALFVIRLGVILFALGSVLGSLSGLLRGLQRMEYGNSVVIMSNVLRVSATFSVLALGFGIKGLIVANGVIMPISFILLFYFSKRLFPSLSLNPFHFRVAVLKKLLGFGVKVQVSQFASFVNFQLDRVLVSHYIGIASVVFYDLGIKVSRAIRDLPLLVRSALMPAVAELHAKGEQNRIYEIFLKTLRYSIVIGMPALFFLFFNADLAILAWVGPGFSEATVILRIVIWGYFVNMIGGGVTSIVQGIGKPKYQMRAALLSLTLNLVLSILFILKFGFYGAAVGTLLAMTLSGIYYQVSFQCLMKRSVLRFIKIVFLKPLLLALLPNIVLWILNYFVISELIGTNRWLALGVVVVEFGLFFFVFMLLTIRWNYLRKEDTKILARIPILGTLYLKFFQLLAK